MAFQYYKNKDLKPTTYYYKFLIYNTLLYKNNKLKTSSKEDILKFIITIIDITLRFSSCFKDNSYLQNWIKKKLKSKTELNFLLRLRIQLFKCLAKRNIALVRAIED